MQNLFIAVISYSFSQIRKEKGEESVDVMPTITDDEQSHESGDGSTDATHQHRAQAAAQDSSARSGVGSGGGFVQTFSPAQRPRLRMQVRAATNASIVG